MSLVLFCHLSCNYVVNFNVWLSVLKFPSQLLCEYIFSSPFFSRNLWWCCPSFMLRHIWRFNDLTDAYRSPQKFGALGGFVNQVILFLQLNTQIRRWSSFVAKACINSSSPLVPIFVFELSLYITSGIPQRAVDRFSAARQSSFVKEITGSMRTVLVLKEIKSAT